ncbi:hypothetical protein MMC12_004076 [Toensbergia leucococca]|nr:hypothetical protein [Toensbergia leucococca]
MSDFLSSQAERALMGDEAEAHRIFQDIPSSTTPATSHAHMPLSPAQWNLTTRPHGDIVAEAGRAFRQSLQPAARMWHSSPSQSLTNLCQDPARSRSTSPNVADLQNFGILNTDGSSWRCAYPGCASQVIFTRGSDLRKHFRRHSKSLFCRHEGCPQSTEGGFSTKKDRDRHEAKHAPMVPCDYEGCERIFSRVDNMKDHVRRMHRKA